MRRQYTLGFAGAQDGQYHQIEVTATDPKRERPSLLSWLLLGQGSEPGREARTKSADIPKKAVKCDMCKGLEGGAACVRACPTGAAIRVSPEQFVNFADANE